MPSLTIRGLGPANAPERLLFLLGRYHAGMQLILALMLACPPLNQDPLDGTLEILGEVPVVFGCEVTTLRDYTEDLAERAGGRRTVYDRKGQPIDTVEWWLNLALSRPAASRVPVIRIDSPELIEALGLTSRNERRAENVRGYFGLSELKPRMQALRESEALPDVAGIGAMAADAGFRMGALLAESDRFPLSSKVDGDSWAQWARSIAAAAGPSLVPPSTKGGPWRLYSSWTHDPSLLSSAGWIAVHDLLVAWRARDYGTAMEAAQRWSDLAEGNGPPEAGLHFQRPSTWTPIGGAHPLTSGRFAEIGGIGVRVASFHLKRGEEQCRGGFVYSGDAHRPIVDMHDLWRWRDGELPQPKGTPPPKAGDIFVRTAAEHERPSLGTVLRREGATFVVTLSGSPKLLADSRGEFQELIDSVECQESIDLDAVFGVSTVQRKDPGTWNNLASIEILSNESHTIVAALQVKDGDPATAVQWRQEALAAASKRIAASKAAPDENSPIEIIGTLLDGWDLDPNGGPFNLGSRWHRSEDGVVAVLRVHAFSTAPPEAIERLRELCAYWYAMPRSMWTTVKDSVQPVGVEGGGATLLVF